MPSVDRLLALSDGVVAIALTLLVLQLRVPSLPSASADSASALAAALAKGGDQLTAYVISFYVVAQFWLVHHRVFQHLVGQEEGPGLVELRVPVHDHDHAVHQRPAG